MIQLARMWWATPSPIWKLDVDIVSSLHWFQKLIWSGSREELGTRHTEVFSFIMANYRRWEQEDAQIWGRVGLLKRACVWQSLGPMCNIINFIMGEASGVEWGGGRECVCLLICSPGVFVGEQSQSAMEMKKSSLFHGDIKSPQLGGRWIAPWTRIKLNGG